MKTTFFAVLAGSLLLATTFTTADAARKQCGAGSVYSKSKRACVPAAVQAKTCMAFTDDGGLTRRPCQ